jgi:hypothetical protein
MDMTQHLDLAVHTFPGERPVLLIHGLTRSAQLDWIEPGWHIAATLPDATYLTVPGDHFGALMSPEFRAAAIGFLG